MFAHFLHFNPLRPDHATDVNDIPDDIEVPADHIVREQWLLAMFREGEEDMRDFVGPSWCNSVWLQAVQCATAH